jgi:hypothetical protein
MAKSVLFNVACHDEPSTQIRQLCEWNYLPAAKEKLPAELQSLSYMMDHEWSHWKSPNYKIATSVDGRKDEYGQTYHYALIYLHK